MIIEKKSLFTKKKVLPVVSFIVLLLGSAHTGILLAGEGPCSIPDTELTVIIDGCDSGVSNDVVEQDCTVSDKITQCAMSAQNHGEFVSCVAHLTNDLKKQGKITGKDKGKIQSCAAKADIPCEECESPAISGEPHRFSFETGTDELSVEIRKVYKYYTATLTPDLNIVEMDKQRNEGIQYLHNHPEAADMLISEASRLDPFDSNNLLVIFHLLGYVNSDAGVNFLFNKVIQSVPEGCVRGTEIGCDDFDLIRSTALEAIGKVRATTGNAQALEKMLDLVGSEDTLIQGHSVKLVYEKGGMSRWRAKRVMYDRLPAGKHYLLYETY